MPRSYSIGEFADELGVHAQTVKRWCRNDDLDYTRTPGGERRIPHRELRRLTGDTRLTDCVALYGRVSSHGHKNNGGLDRQLDRLTDHAHDHGWSVENTYTDVGSGLNSFLMTYRTPTTGVFSLPTKTDSLDVASRTSNGISTATASLSPSSKTRPTNRHRKNSLTTSSNSSPVSAANSMECGQKNNRSSTPSNPR